MLEPGRYQARTIGIDFSHLEDRMVAAFAIALRDGTVMIKQTFDIPRGSSKPYMHTIHGLYDMIDWTQLRPSRNKRNRHYKAKAQPNCGPRGDNPW